MLTVRINFNVLNNLSAVQDVTGKVQSRNTRDLILGKKCVEVWHIRKCEEMISRDFSPDQST